MLVRSWQKQKYWKYIVADLEIEQDTVISMENEQQVKMEITVSCNDIRFSHGIDIVFARQENVDDVMFMHSISPFGWHLVKKAH